MVSTPVLLVLAGIAATALYRFLSIGRRPNFLPGGPATIPVFGNALQFPRSNAYLQFTEWASEYGGIFSLMIGPKPLIVITDARIARELIDKKGGAVSDRPPNHIVRTVTDNKYLTFAPYSPQWKRARTMVQKLVTKEQCVNYLPIIQAEGVQLMYDVLTDPDDFFNHTARYSYSIATTLLAGSRSPQSTSSILINFQTMMHKWSGMLEPGSQPPIDIVPALQYIPKRWAPWKDLCVEIREKQFELYNSLVSQCQKRIEANNGNGCFLETILADKNLGADLDLVRGTMGAFLEGATDTTALYLKNLILHLSSSPEAQAKAHEEIDAVIGSQRLPELADFASLPFTQAITKEILRIRPPVPVGVPHHTTEEVAVDNYVIPKGTTVFLNQYGILHDPAAYDDPTGFHPERFIKHPLGLKDGAEEGDRNNEHHFGGGRRICVGMHLANNTVQLITMFFLWGLQFDAPIDPVTKKRIPIDIHRYSEGIASAPLPFKCSITPRSPVHGTVILREFARAWETFEKYEHDLTPEDEVHIRNLRSNLQSTI